MIIHYFESYHFLLSRYNYQREDEEVYKEFLEVANELIPTILKQATVYHSRDARHIPKDPECYGFYLRLYDNICKWEEGSSTPVLHITWAKHFVASVTKFDSSIRDQLDVRLIDAEGKEEVEEKEEDNEEEMKEEEGEEDESETKKGVKDKEEDINKNVVSAPDEADGCGKKGKAENEGERSEDNINPELFSDPFAGTGLLWDTKTEFSDFLSTRSNGSAFPGMTLESLMKAESPAEMAFQRRLKSQLSQDDNDNAQGQSDSKQNEEGDDEDDETKDELEDSINLPPQPVPKILLRSAKMKGLRGILTSTSKLNTAAIHLQLTAQSQVQVGKRIRSTNDYEDYGTLRRRPRRE